MVEQRVNFLEKVPESLLFLYAKLKSEHKNCLKVMIFKLSDNYLQKRGWECPQIGTCQKAQ